MDNLFIFMLLFAVVFLFLGAYYAQKTFLEYSDLNLEEGYKKSNMFRGIALFLLVAFAIAAILLQNDLLLEKTPLFFQRLSTLYTWGIFASFITFVSGFVLLYSYLREENVKRYMLSLLVLNILFFVLFFRINQPISDLITVSASKDNGYMQTTDYSCTAASLATIIHRSGRRTNEKQIAYLSGLTKFGATSGQLRYTLSVLGLAFSTLHDTDKKLKDIKPPVLLYIDNAVLGKESHAVVYWRHTGTACTLWDPLKGKRVIEDKEIEKIWHGNGIQVKL